MWRVGRSLHGLLRTTWPISGPELTVAVSQAQASSLSGQDHPQQTHFHSLIPTTPSPSPANDSSSSSRPYTTVTHPRVTDRCHTASYGASHHIPAWTPAGPGASPGAGAFSAAQAFYIPTRGKAQHAETATTSSSSSEDTRMNSQGSASTSTRPDPFSLVKDEIESVTERLRRCIVSDIPVLERAAEYFFRKGREGKRLRSTILLLLASSLAAVPVGPSDITVDDRPANHPPAEERRKQQRLAEITELIHVASLLHDDVIDNADKRRGLQALNALFGNKVAILAGDFLLARASVTLAALRDSEVIALMSQVLENLVAGEILQMTASKEEVTSMDYYLRKTFFKTASLLANSCKSVALLAGCDEHASLAAWDYGRHLGLAFQLIDDVLDFTGKAEEMGKAPLTDLRSGLATAPVLFAAEQHSELLPLIQRRFKEDGDVEMAIRLVERSDGIRRAREMADMHAVEAGKALERLPTAATEHAETTRRALEDVLSMVLNRRK